MCSSSALTHTTALFRTTDWLRIFIQLKQFSASIRQPDLIHQSNDTNGVVPSLLPLTTQIREGNGESCVVGG